MTGCSQGQNCPMGADFAVDVTHGDGAIAPFGAPWPVCALHLPLLIDLLYAASSGHEPFIVWTVAR